MLPIPLRHGVARIAAIAAVLAMAFAGSAYGDDLFDRRGVTYNVVPRDAIPALTLPEYVATPQATYLHNDDRLIIVHYAGTDTAYPTRVLDHHEIVNDLVNGQPLLVTYCPLCGSAAAFIPYVDGTLYVFGVSGSLYQSDLLMYDRQTDSLWDQITGTAVTGRAAGTRLKPYPVAYDSWKHWRTAYPDGRVLALPNRWRQRFGDYATSPYLGYDSFQELWFYVSRLDKRLPNKTRILGVEVLGAFKAYPEDRLSSSQVLHDHVGATPIAFIVDREHSRVGAFDETRHHFELKNGTIVADGIAWTWDGDTLTHRTDREESYSVVPTYWFAWGAIHPKTDIYR